MRENQEKEMLPQASQGRGPEFTATGIQKPSGQCRMLALEGPEAKDCSAPQAV